MRAIHTILLIGAALLSTDSAASADTVQLKSGAILVGDVTLMEGGNAQIATRYPREETLMVTREDLMLRSLYDLLDRCADQGDSEAQPRAGELAELSGLFRAVIADCLAVADLRPDLAKEMTARVHRVWEAVAGGILGRRATCWRTAIRAVPSRTCTLYGMCIRGRRPRNGVRRS